MPRIRTVATRPVVLVLLPDLGVLVLSGFSAKGLSALDHEVSTVDASSIEWPLATSAEIAGLSYLAVASTEVTAAARDTAAITYLFRVVHTIKGTAGMLGLNALVRVAHQAENLMSTMRDGAPFTAHHAELPLDARDVLADTVEHLSCHDDEPPLGCDALVAALAAAASGTAATEESADAATPTPAQFPTKTPPSGPGHFPQDGPAATGGPPATPDDTATPVPGAAPSEERNENGPPPIAPVLTMTPPSGPGHPSHAPPGATPGGRPTCRPPSPAPATALGPRRDRGTPAGTGQHPRCRGCCRRQGPRSAARSPDRGVGRCGHPQRRPGPEEDAPLGTGAPCVP